MHSTATELEIAPGDRIGRVRVTRFDGTSVFVEPRVVVLAAGAIENARLLLASDRDVPGGVGNGEGLVGRFFAEHPHTIVGKVVSSLDDRSMKFYQWVTDLPGRRPAAVRAGLAITAEAQRRDKLLQCSLTLDPSPDGPPGGLPTSVERTLKDLYGGSPRYFDLMARAEQGPDPESRVRLGDERDRLGMPKVVLDWRVDEATRRSIRRAVELAAAAIGRAGIGRVFSYAHRDDDLPGAHFPALGGGCHHMGTTRMDEDPRRGVVDANCKVHGVANLYVAGSSVFPTSGQANPTLTLVALALRLGDHLKETWS